MGLHYGTPLRDFPTALAAQEAAIAKHSHYYTDAPGWLIRAEACSYAAIVPFADPISGEGEWYTTDPRIELFAFPVKRFTPCGATLNNIWTGAKERWVNLKPGEKQWASRTAVEAVEQLRNRRRGQIHILNKQLARAKRELELTFCESVMAPL